MGGSTPQNEKMVVKTNVISGGFIFSNNFSKEIDKNSICLLNFDQKVSKFSYRFPNQFRCSSKSGKFLSCI